MTTVFTSAQFEQHQTGRHPENPIRIEVLREMIEDLPEEQRPQTGSFQAATLLDLERVHSQAHIKNVHDVADAGGGHLDADTVVSPKSYEVALLAAGAACKAVSLVTSSAETNALCLIRPPGHHAVPDHAMGFCLFNNVAVATRYAQQVCGLQRILIVDWDVHHGNGTQDVFYDDETVTFFSIHRFPFYPGSGDRDETGRGAGLGTTFNEPIAFGTSREEYFQRFERTLQRAADRAKPELVLISAGFDAHRLDPIGSLGLETEDFARLTDLVTEVAETYCHGRIVSLLEGGYHPQALADSVKAHLLRLQGKPLKS